MSQTDSLQIKELTPDQLEEIVSSLPKDLYVPFEQSPVWARVFEEPPVRTHYGNFAFYRGGELALFVSCFRYLRPNRQSIASLASPVFLHERTPELEKAFIDALSAHVKADPSIDPMYIRIPLKHPEHIDGAVQSIERGMFEREIVVDINKTPAEIKRGFSSSAKNYLNKSSRLGVEVREITENRFEYFNEFCWPIMMETSNRNGFEAEPLSFFKRLLDRAPDNTRMYVAYAPATAEEDPRTAEKIPVSWSITNEYHHRGCYYMAASSQRAQECRAMYALMMRMLTDLRETGNLACGLTGISSKRWPELKPLDTYKMSFSKQVVEYPSLYDIPLRPLNYQRLKLTLKARNIVGTQLRALKAKVSEKVGK